LFKEAHGLFGKGTEIYNTAKGAIEDGKAKAEGMVAGLEQIPKEAEAGVKRNLEKVETEVRSKAEAATERLKDG
jgi:hypothetical protein